MDGDHVLFKNELMATKTFKMLQRAYGNECLSLTNIFEWYDKFCNGRENVDDDPRVGCSRTSQTPEHITKIHAALEDDRRSTIIMLVEQFHIDKETVCKFIAEDLGEKKLCVRFVPHVLMSEQRENRLTPCRDFLQMYKNELEFLNKIITGDETWCFAYNLESKWPECNLGQPSIALGKETSLRKVAHQNHVSVFFRFPRAHL